MKLLERTPVSRPLRVLATLAGFAVIALAVGLTVAPGGASRRPHSETIASTKHASTQQGGMAGMNMSGPPAPPKLPANSPCTPRVCPIPKPGPDELAVAGQLGSATAAAWVTRNGGQVQARVEVLNLNLGPVREPVRFDDATTQRSCGPGCWLLTLPTDAAKLTLSAVRHGHRYAVSLPLSWQPGRAARARALVARAVQTMSGLVGLRLEERLATGTPGSPGALLDIHFRLRAPNAMSATATGHRDRQVTIGSTQWNYTPGVGWTSGGYYDGNGHTVFNTASLFTWHQDEQSAQVLSDEMRGDRRVAVIALMNPQVPAWLQMTVETRTALVRHVKIVSQGKFTDDRFSDYGVPQRVVPPTIP